MTEHIHLDTVRIFGFRGIKNLEMSMSRVTVLIGQNNSGKTSFIKALQLALGDYSRYITEEDFYISSDENRVDKIIIDIKFVPTSDGNKKTQEFNEIWSREFGDKINSENNLNQFMVMRTVVKPDEVKGGFECLRYIMQSWPENNGWETIKERGTDKTGRILSTPLISIEAQRDIHYELKDRNSFVGKVLANVKYSKPETEKIETLIKVLNQSAIDNNDTLKNLSEHLTQLNDSFKGAGNVEITPFPKKIRDLSKHFSIHFGETQNGVFSMEYHGMGTRSWASMLTVKAFLDDAASKHDEEQEPFFPIFAAEEPEAHLHPNAQKTIYTQIAEIKGQVIVSTHSSYIASMSNINNIRALKNTSNGVIAKSMTTSFSDVSNNNFENKITSQHGEILFSNAVILCEGVTEEQLFPAMFELNVGKSLFSLGIICVSVGGKNYKPYISLACSFGIPTYIVSDNDGDTKNSVQTQIANLKNSMNQKLGGDIFGISFLTEGNDIEAELLNELNLKEEITESLIASETILLENEKHIKDKTSKILKLNNKLLLHKMRNNKSSYSKYLSEIIKKSKDKDDKIPIAVMDAIEQIKIWCQL